MINKHFTRSSLASHMHLMLHALDIYYHLFPLTTIDTFVFFNSMGQEDGSYTVQLVLVPRTHIRTIQSRRCVLPSDTCRQQCCPKHKNRPRCPSELDPKRTERVQSPCRASACQWKRGRQAWSSFYTHNRLNSASWFLYLNFSSQSQACLSILCTPSAEKSSWLAARWRWILIWQSSRIMK